MPKNKKSIEEKYQEVIDALKKDHKQDDMTWILSQPRKNIKFDYEKYKKFIKVLDTKYKTWPSWPSPPRWPAKNTYKIFTNNTTRRINA